MSIVTHTETGDEIVQGTFSVVQAAPQLTIVDPVTGMQGATVTVNLVGSYTGFNDATVFDFGPGITVLESQVFGGLVAQVRVAIDHLAALGARYITAATGAEVVTAQFTVTPSTAVIVAVTPNTARQGQSVSVEVVGQNTDWTGATIFNFGAGTTVTDGVVDSPDQHATLTVAVDALAPVGARAVTAQIGGQLAALINGFVVQPGTPLILSSSPASGQQQASVTLTILGQATAWDQTTTVDLGPGVAVLTVQPDECDRSDRRRGRPPAGAARSAHTDGDDRRAGADPRQCVLGHAGIRRPSRSWSRPRRDKARPSTSTSPA